MKKPTSGNIGWIKMGCSCVFAIMYTFHILRGIEIRTAGLFILSIPIAVSCYFAVSLIGAQDRMVLRTGYYVLFLLCLLLFALNMLTPSIAFDTWQVYDMSRYVFSDFGYMDQIRQHIQNTHYEMAFPPLYPILMNLINRAQDLGVLSAVYINGIASMLTISAFIKLGNVCNLNKFIVMLTAYCMILSTDCRVVNRWGVTQTTGFLILLLIIIVVLENTFNYKHAIICALLVGIGLMNRFDFLAVSVIMLMLLPLLAKMKGGKTLAQSFFVFVLGTIIFAVTISPWIMYSIDHFGVIFITDNGRRLFNIVDTRPSTYFPAEMPAMTIKDDFWAWAAAFSARVFVSMKSFEKSTVRNSLFGETFILAVGYLLISKYHKKENPMAKVLDVVKQMLSHVNLSIMSVFLLILSQEALVIATGYSATRYHIPFVLLMQYLLMYAVSCIWDTKDELLDKIKAQLPIVGICKVCVLGCTAVCMTALLWYWHNCRGTSDLRKLDGNEAKMAQWLKAQNCQCLFVSRNEPSFPRFSALSGIQATILEPSNLASESVGYFVRDFDVDYIYTTDSTVLETFESKLNLDPTPFPNLYYVLADN